MENLDYERIQHIDLDQDLCRVLKTDAADQALTETTYTAWRESLFSGDLVHPEDRERLWNFLLPEHIRAAAVQAAPKARWIIYRRKTARGYRWNVLEVIWRQEGGYLLCALDIHDVVREGQAREGLDPNTLEQLRQDVQMAGILKSRFKMMNTVDLETGQCRRVDLSAADQVNNVMTGDYTSFITRALEQYVHPADGEVYWSTLSLDHLREQAAKTEDYAEEICAYRLRGETPRWIELRIIYARQDGQVTVNILGQDVTREKRQEEFRRQLLEERDTMISSLSTLFFSTYYIDLEQNSFRAVTQLRRVGDLLGEEMNCSAGLRIYADHFIHPDDREEYLRVMDCENLRQNLRWWNPYVAIEYRKLPDFPGDTECKWVRATAVLARSGKDDMPKTAVYVAQNIGENRQTAP